MPTGLAWTRSSNRLFPFAASLPEPYRRWCLTGQLPPDRDVQVWPARLLPPLVSAGLLFLTLGLVLPFFLGALVGLGGRLERHGLGGMVHSPGKLLVGLLILGIGGRVLVTVLTSVSWNSRERATRSESLPPRLGLLLTDDHLLLRRPAWRCPRVVFVARSEVLGALLSARHTKGGVYHVPVVHVRDASRASGYREVPLGGSCGYEASDGEVVAAVARWAESATAGAGSAVPRSQATVR